MFQVFSYAELHNASQLKKHCLDYIIKNIANIKYTTDWYQFCSAKNSSSKLLAELNDRISNELIAVRRLTNRRMRRITYRKIDHMVIVNGSTRLCRTPILNNGTTKRIAEERRVASFKVMLTDSKYHDVTFVTELGRKRFSAPSNLLIAQSDVLEEMLSDECEVAKEKCFTIDNIEPDVFAEFLLFLITGKVSNNEAFTFELYDLAKTVLLSGSFYLTNTQAYCLFTLTNKLSRFCFSQFSIVQRQLSEKDMRDRHCKVDHRPIGL